MVYHPPKQPIADPEVLEYLRRDCCNKAEAWRVYVEIFDGDVSYKKLHAHLTGTYGYRWVLHYSNFCEWMNGILRSVPEIRDAIRGSRMPCK